MKRALAKWLQALADKLDKVAAYDREQTQRNLARVLIENLELHEKIPASFSLPEVSPEWTPTNAQALALFLNTPDGQRLSLRLRTIVAANAITGAQNAANTIHAAGRSAGWDEAVRYLLSLSRVSGVQGTTNDKAPSGETELLEHLSP